MGWLYYSSEAKDKGLDICKSQNRLSLQGGRMEYFSMKLAGLDWSVNRMKLRLSVQECLHALHVTLGTTAHCELSLSMDFTNFN